MSRRLVCEGCGTEFGCGVDDATCWCAREEFRLPLPVAGADGPSDCLCPDCLRRLAASRGR